MKIHLTLLTLTVISLVLICGGCQSENAAADELTAVQPPTDQAETMPVEEAETILVEKAETARPEIEPVLDVKVEPAVEPVATETSAPAQPPRTRRGGRGLNGDWQVKTGSADRQREAILSFSRDREGTTTGQWISFRGLEELADITFEDNKLSFTRTSQGRDGQTTTSTFAGTITDGVISGTLTSDRGDSELTGQRSRQMSRVAGSWELKMNMGEQGITSTLVITSDEDGDLGAECQSPDGENEITDVQYQRRTLTFKKINKSQGSQQEATFEGTIQGTTLTGAFTSDKGEVPVEGTLIGGSLIGSWNLDLTSDRGDRKQRLRINPDLSGMYGSAPIEKVSFQDGQVSFKIVQAFGDRTFEMSFEGKQDEAALTGEITTSRGSQTVTGTKIVRTRGGRGTR